MLKTIRIAVLDTTGRYCLACKLDAEHGIFKPELKMRPNLDGTDTTRSHATNEHKISASTMRRICPFAIKDNLSTQSPPKLHTTEVCSPYLELFDSHDKKQ